MTWWTCTVCGSRWERYLVEGHAAPEGLSKTKSKQAENSGKAPTIPGGTTSS